jgi:hypothetical protein
MYGFRRMGGMPISPMLEPRVLSLLSIYRTVGVDASLMATLAPRRKRMWW